MEERFIDADTPFEKETISYDDLVIKQINVCRDVLSKDEFGSGVRLNSSNVQVGYTSDIKKESINCVDTFKRMMIPFLKGGDYLKWVEEIDADIENKKNELGEKIIFVKGFGDVKLKDAGLIDNEHPLHRQFILYQYEKARDLFEVLIRAYHQNKALIKSFEEE